MSEGRHFFRVTSEQESDKRVKCRQQTQITTKEIQESILRHIGAVYGSLRAAMKDLGVDLRPHWAATRSDTNLLFAVPHQRPLRRTRKPSRIGRMRKEGLEGVLGGLEERLPGIVRDVPRRLGRERSAASATRTSRIESGRRANIFYPRGLTFD
jgi:hypothetical protein